jgi:hypothetical protein
MVEREERRLRRAFRRILLAAMAAPLATQACSSSRRDEPSHTSDASSTGDAGDEPDPCLPTFLDAARTDADPCSALAYAPCGPPSGVHAGSSICAFTLAECSYFCADFFFSCHATAVSCDDGSLPEYGPITVDCVTCPGGVGRRPAGLETAHLEQSANALGDYFARIAHLEAASIRAFRDLRSELVERGAPQTLVCSALRAANDEVRHARAMGRLAQRFGSSPPRARVRMRERRSLEAMASENAVEGCIRETYGALLASWQAAHARDSEVAAEMARIADD